MSKVRDAIGDLRSIATLDDVQTFTAKPTFGAGADVTGDMAISGIVTKPLQPAFSAVSSGAQSNISLIGEVTVVFGTEIFDQSNDFTANTFTAPVAGKYLLNTILRLDNLDSAANYYRLYIVTSNRTYFTIWTTLRFSADINYWSLQNTVFADMDAGDTAYVTMQQSAGSVQTDITSGQSYFQGHLVC
jgi:hypothetical protein